MSHHGLHISVQEQVGCCGHLLKASLQANLFLRHHATMHALRRLLHRRHVKLKARLRALMRIQYILLLQVLDHGGDARHLCPAPHIKHMVLVKHESELFWLLDGTGALLLRQKCGSLAISIHRQ